MQRRFALESSLQGYKKLETPELSRPLLGSPAVLFLCRPANDRPTRQRVSCSH